MYTKHDWKFQAYDTITKQFDVFADIDLISAMSVNNDDTAHFAAWSIIKKINLTSKDFSNFIWATTLWDKVWVAAETKFWVITGLETHNDTMYVLDNEYNKLKRVNLYTLDSSFYYDFTENKFFDPESLKDNNNYYLSIISDNYEWNDEMFKDDIVYIWKVNNNMPWAMILWSNWMDKFSELKFLFSEERDIEKITFYNQNNLIQNWWSSCIINVLAEANIDNEWVQIYKKETSYNWKASYTQLWIYENDKLISWRNLDIVFPAWVVSTDEIKLTFKTSSEQCIMKTDEIKVFKSQDDKIGIIWWKEEWYVEKNFFSMSKDDNLWLLYIANQHAIRVLDIDKNRMDSLVWCESWDCDYDINEQSRSLSFEKVVFDNIKDIQFAYDNQNKKVLYVLTRLGVRKVSLEDGSVEMLNSWYMTKTWENYERKDFKNIAAIDWSSDFYYYDTNIKTIKKWEFSWIVRDEIPPAKIDLSIKTGDWDTAYLEWLSVWDDMRQWKVMDYKIYYIEWDVLNDSNIENASTFDYNIEVIKPWEKHQLILSNKLLAWKKYSIAIKAIDDELNESEISNVVNFTPNIDLDEKLAIVSWKLTSDVPSVILSNKLLFLTSVSKNTYYEARTNNNWDFSFKNIIPAFDYILQTKINESFNQNEDKVFEKEESFWIFAKQYEKDIQVSFGYKLIWKALDESWQAIEWALVKAVNLEIAWQWSQNITMTDKNWDFTIYSLKPDNRYNIHISKQWLSSINDNKESFSPTLEWSFTKDFVLKWWVKIKWTLTIDQWSWITIPASYFYLKIDDNKWTTSLVQTDWSWNYLFNWLFEWKYNVMLQDNDYKISTWNTIIEISPTDINNWIVINNNMQIESDYFNVYVYLKDEYWSLLTWSDISRISMNIIWWDEVCWNDKVSIDQEAWVIRIVELKTWNKCEVNIKKDLYWEKQFELLVWEHLDDQDFVVNIIIPKSEVSLDLLEVNVNKSSIWQILRYRTEYENNWTELMENVEFKILIPKYTNLRKIFIWNEQIELPELENNYAYISWIKLPSWESIIVSYEVWISDAVNKKYVAYSNAAMTYKWKETILWHAYTDVSIITFNTPWIVRLSEHFLSFWKVKPNSVIQFFKKQWEEDAQVLDSIYSDKIMYKKSLMINEEWEYDLYAWISLKDWSFIYSDTQFSKVYKCIPWIKEIIINWTSYSWDDYFSTVLIRWRESRIVVTTKNPMDLQYDFLTISYYDKNNELKELIFRPNTQTRFDIDFKVDEQMNDVAFNYYSFTCWFEAENTSTTIIEAFKVEK